MQIDQRRQSIGGAGLAVLLAMVGPCASAAPKPAVVPPPATPTWVVPCPAVLQFQAYLTPSDLAGWSPNPASITLTLDRSTTPQVQNLNLYCFYKAAGLKTSVVLQHQVGPQHCKGRKDGAGFDCTG